MSAGGGSGRSGRNGRNGRMCEGRGQVVGEIREPKQMVIKKNGAGYAPCSVPIWIPVFFALLWLIPLLDVPGRKKTGMTPV